MSLLALFCYIDDFCQQFQQAQQPSLPAQTGQRRRQPGLCESETMTILIYLHQSGYCHFKTYYLDRVQAHLRAEFPRLVSYSRFLQLMPRVMLLLWAYFDLRP